MRSSRTGDRGYREIAHTADWALHVWAPDLKGLLVTAAEGMYDLLGVVTDPNQPVQQHLALEAMDAESLLVAFLNELVFQLEERRAFWRFDLEVKGTQLEGELKGARVIGQGKEIKAVTYHDLAIRKGERGLEVTVVFDV